MSKSIARTLSLVLVFCMVFMAFTGCHKSGTTDTSTDETSSAESVTPIIVQGEGFTVADGNAYLQFFEENGEKFFQVVDGTTMEQFLSAIVLDPGYTMKLFNADGSEVTDPAAVLIEDTSVNVYDASGAQTGTYLIKILADANALVQAITDAVSEMQQEDPNASVPSITIPSVVSNDNNGGGTSGGSSSVTADKFVNLRNQDFTFATIYPDGYASNSGTKALYNAKFDEIKSTAGINFTRVDLTPDSAVNQITTDVLAGKPVGDVVELSIPMCRALAKAQVLADWSGSTTLNTSTFSNGATESCSFGTHKWGVAFAYMASNPMGVLYNKSIVSRYSPNEYSQLTALYLNKQWNWDVYMTILKNCTVDTNGDGKTDIYGLLSNTNVIGQVLTSNAGGTAVMVNGRVDASLCSAAGIKALEWIKNVYNQKYWKYTPNHTDAVNYFVAGEGATLVFYLSVGLALMNGSEDFEIGFLPFPMGPDQSDYITATYDGTVFAVPKTSAGSLEKDGEFLNELAKVSNECINFTVNSYQNYGVDNNGILIYKWAVKNTSADYSSGAFSSTVATTCDQSVLSKAKEPSTSMTSIKSLAQSELDDYYKNLY